MFTKIRRTVQKYSEDFNKIEIRNRIKVEILKLHNNIPELKNSLVVRFNYRLDQMEEKINEPKDRTVKLIQSEQKE